MPQRGPDVLRRSFQRLERPGIIKVARPRRRRRPEHVEALEARLLRCGVIGDDVDLAPDDLIFVLRDISDLGRAAHD